MNSASAPVWRVADLLAALSGTLSRQFAQVTVDAELAGFTRAASGHCYFSLKDADGSPALIRAALFRRSAAALRFAPQDGQRVRATGRLALYEPRGELQFVAESLEPAGAGALYEQFLRLKAQLASEGWFDAGRKRVLPSHPQALGVVTSQGAAALRDVLTALARRAPHVRVVVYPSVVQGAEAPAALVAALTAANARAEVDAVLLVRGGGSMEDLWAFNDPGLVRAVASSALPVVCGVGHETDITLCDLAADLRAPTPTAAAELAAPPREAQLRELQSASTALRDAVLRRLDQHAQRLDRATLRLARPTQALNRQAMRLQALQQRLRSAVSRSLAVAPARLERLSQAREAAWQAQVTRHAHRLQSLGERLDALAPQRTLARGFAYLSDDQGRAVTRAAQLSPQQSVRAQLADGEAALRVEAVSLPLLGPEGAL
ncbi:exodeoxyribonuclease VII large subunit [Inhella crocodyli]|uniref:Exodeoxyribonuclease 7 large subunit n=1 Tax=Inhella crocodyli TaxID=2499851 RepID=A0A3S2URZ3_9BURK|nr:exodeoxyribonuclease VII large subunit [Inhella crocodyli]RVT83012.1 exodeoxyribonuclease VII large subunit [Inhella crocodyli]